MLAQSIRWIGLIAQLTLLIAFVYSLVCFALGRAPSDPWDLVVFGAGAICVLALVGSDLIRCEECGSSYFERHPELRSSSNIFTREVTSRCEICDFVRGGDRK